MAGKSTEKQVQNAMRYSSVGMEFTATFLMCLGVGYWLDRKLDTLPGFMLLFGVVGLAGALYRLIRQSRQFQREQDSLRSEDEKSQQDQ